MLMIGYCYYIYSGVLYPYFFQDNSRRVPEGEFEFTLYMSIANACFTAFFWWGTYMTCKHLVSKPLKKAGFSNFILTLNGSWYFFFLGGVCPAMMGLVITSGAIESGLAREYPLFLLNMIGPLASLGALVFAFPPPGVLKKVFDIIAPEEEPPPPEPPEPPEDGEQGQ
jgi:hypothetical protein